MKHQHHIQKYLQKKSSSNDTQSKNSRITKLQKNRYVLYGNHLRTLITINSSLQNVFDHTIFSRSTAFLVKSNFKDHINDKLSFIPKYHIITVAHVTHPYLFRKTIFSHKQYSLLDTLDQKKFKIRAQIRQQGTGRVMIHGDFPLHSRSFFKPGYDLVILHFKNQHVEKQVENFHQRYYNIPTIPTFKLDRHPIHKQDVILLGHNIQDLESLEMYPSSLDGNIHHISSNQNLLFIKTSSLIEMGWCGGPVSIININASSSKQYDHQIGHKYKNGISHETLTTTTALGMIEARVDKDKLMHPEIPEEVREMIGDTTMVMTSSFILDFVQKVEDEFHTWPSSNQNTQFVKLLKHRTIGDML